MRYPTSGACSPSSGALIKRAKGTPPPSNQIAISSSGEGDKNKGLIRTAPIVSLAGAHSNEILSCRFDPTGKTSPPVSADRSVSLWRTYPPNNNYGLLSSLTKAPILDLQWSLFAPHIYTVAADHTLLILDVTTGQRIINSVDRTMAGGSGTELVVTGADDGLVPVAEFDVGCPVTAVCWSADGASVYAAALDNEIHIYDLRKSTQLSTLSGHTDTPTSLALSPTGAFLLSPPRSPHRRSSTTKSPGDEGKRVAVGGADRMVCVWDVESGRVVYKLPGHKGTVTSVDWHPKEPIILTGSKDGTMLLGELEAGLGV
ncbi:WD40-repeat-containing domain protein [Mycena olivaceomarginata]|nr:WD40-repeat-containing domain protein [Mycena olivaceomarginata]